MKNNRLIKNILFISSGYFVNIILNLITLGIITRYLSVEEFGLFNYWLALIGVFSKVVDMGLGPIVLRECSKGGNCPSYMSTSVIFRVLILFFVTIVINIYLKFTDTRTVNFFLANFLLLNIIFSQKFNNIRDILNIPFKVNIKMQVPILINVSENLLLLILISLVYFFKLNFITFLGFYVAANIPGFLLLFFWNLKKENIKLLFELNSLKYLIKESLPLAGYVFLAFFYLQIDIFLIKIFLSEKAVGLYSTAIRLSRPLLIIPASLITTFFPLFVKSIKENKKIDFQIGLIVKVLLIVALSIAITVNFKTDELNVLLFGSEYSGIGLITSLLFWTLIFSFFNFFILDIFTAKGKQKYNLFYIIIVTLTTIVISAVSINFLGLKGAAAARLFSSFLGTMILLNFLKRINLKIKFFSFRILLWAMCSFILLDLISALNIFFYFPLALTFIIVCAFILRVFNSDEILFLRQQLKHG